VTKAVPLASVAVDIYSFIQFPDVIHHWGASSEHNGIVERFTHLERVHKMVASNEDKGDGVRSPGVSKLVGVVDPPLVR
jgi:hypothetical protein